MNAGQLLTAAFGPECREAAAAKVVRRGEKTAIQVVLDRLAHKVAGMTPRVLEVAERMETGAGNREIAAALGISTKTLDIHRAEAYEQLGVKGAGRLARLMTLRRLAMAAGLWPTVPPRNPAASRRRETAAA